MKRRVLINGKKIQSREQLHLYLKTQFNLPDYYGNNLDALWDYLSHNKSIEKITLINSIYLFNILGEYGQLLMNVFIDLQNKNSIELLIYPEGRKYETK